MPTYEYACRECGRHLEVQQSFSDASLTECPTCAGPLRKVFAPPGISFKGSGFYKNDSRSSGPSTSKSTSGDGGASAPTGGGDSSGASTGGGDSGGSKAPATPAPASSGDSAPSKPAATPAPSKPAPATS